MLSGTLLLLFLSDAEDDDDDDDDDDEDDEDDADAADDDDVVDDDGDVGEEATAAASGLRVLQTSQNSGFTLLRRVHAAQVHGVMSDGNLSFPPAAANATRRSNHRRMEAMCQGS
jgi:hypothetical protein